MLTDRMIAPRPADCIGRCRVLLTEDLQDDAFRELSEHPRAL
jgi:hypothetical protein